MLSRRDPFRAEPIGRFDDRIQERSATMAIGTLACPHCDAPVILGEARRSVRELLFCPYCGHTGRVRDFLSLATPTRPARVTVRVVLP